MKRWVIGIKEDIEDVEYQAHKFHESMESNYRCKFWSIIVKADVADDFAIRIDDLTLTTITLPPRMRVRDDIPNNFYPNDMDGDTQPYKFTSDKRYFADRNINESNLIIDRDPDGKPKP